MAEVFAGFSEYTDAQVGRVVDYLEQTGQLDNTVIFYCADNGASGEGCPNGSVNENKFFNGYPDDLAENTWRCSTSWALPTPTTTIRRAGRWRSRHRSRCSSATPSSPAGHAIRLVIHWPKGIKAKGEVRHQYHHATDIVPTILDVAGIEMPEEYRGIQQYPVQRGVDALQLRRRGCADQQEAAVLRDAGHPRDLAGGLEGRRRCTRPSAGTGHFDQDKWELFHVDEDRSEAKNVADQNPDKLKELIDAVVRGGARTTTSCPSTTAPGRIDHH